MKNTTIQQGKKNLILCEFISQNSTPKISKLNYNLTKPDTELILIAKIEGRNSQKFITKISITHKAPYTKSKILIKSALQDHSEIDLTGFIKIEEKAKNSQSHFEHHALLLSDNAVASTKPFMQIDCKEVRADHAATISYPDKNAIFYLQSRGIPQNTATKIYVKNFLNEDLENYAKSKKRAHTSESK